MSKPSPTVQISRREIFATAACFTTIFLFLFLVGNSLFYKGMGDYALYCQLGNNIATQNRPSCDLVFSISEDSFPLLTKTAGEISAGSLASKDYSSYNYFHFHGHYVSYAYSYILRWFPAQAIFPAVHILSLAGLLFLLYYYLRTKGVAIMASAVFCFLVSCHPAWGVTLFGQFYIDRIFIFTAFALAFCLDADRPRLWLVILTAFFSAMVVERGAVIAGVFTVAYTIFHCRRFGLRTTVAFLIVGVSVLAWAFFQIKVLLTASWSQAAYSGFLASPFQFLGDPVIREKLYVFLAINLPLLLVFGFFRPRAALIGLCVLIPNICGNIGGAEKTGWITHYHSMYFPILVWSAAAGYSTFCNAGARAWKRWAAVPLALGICALYIFVIPQDQPTPAAQWSPRWQRIDQLSWYRSWQVFRDRSTVGGLHASAVKQHLALQAAVPAGTSVSCLEFNMMALYKDRKVDLFPVGVDNDDYIVMGYDTSQSGENRFHGATSFISADEGKKIDRIALERMRRRGFDMDSPTLINNFAVFSRTRQAKGEKTRADPSSPQ
jgi:hypothetical protein